MERRTKTLVGLYCLASSVMLVTNKRAVMLLPAPNLLLALQLISTCLLAIGMHFAGATTMNFRPHKAMVLAYSSVALVFFSTLYGNIKILEHAGVNAFIIVRSCTPFAVCVLDYCFLGRTLPNARSSVAMVTTAASCFIYISMKGGSSTEWGVDSLFWCAAWYSMFVFDQVFIKAIVDKYPASGWERTLYQNFFAGGISCLGLLLSPPTSVIAANGSLFGWLVVLASCVVGGSLSYSGMSLRGEVTATMFTVLGVGCKMFSILLNEAFVESNNSPSRLLVLAVAVLSSAAYQQAPRRIAPKAANPDATV